MYMSIKSFVSPKKFTLKRKQLYLQIFGVILIFFWIWLIVLNTLWDRDVSWIAKYTTVVSGQNISWNALQESITKNVKTAVHDMGEWFSTGQMQLLHDSYQKEKSIDIAKSLLKQYILQNNFSFAYELLAKMKKEDQLDALSGELVSFIAFNYSLVDSKNPAIKLELMSSPIKETYELLYLLAEKKYSVFLELLDKHSKDDLIKNQPMIAVFLQDRQTFRTLKDSKSYYLTWLFAVSLMKAGYTSLAMDLANEILEEDKNYILSYELLSQIAIKEKRYQDAVKHLQTLMNIDVQHMTRTAFFLWLSYYYLGDFNSAITYLNQVRDITYAYDAIRYLILIHNEQGEYDKMMDEFRFLLTEQQVDQHDFALFFDILFYEPYRIAGASGDFSLARENAISLIIPYIDLCQKKLTSTAPYICKYWEAWRYLSQNKLEKASKLLLYLSKIYPKPIIFQALWDYYTHQNSIEKANYYYNKAFLQDATQ